MIKSDFHTHTIYCDGKNTPEEMVLAAIDKGFDALGLSGHSYVPYDLDCCMNPEGTAAYRSGIAALRERYADRIKLFCGVEQDFYAPLPEEPFDHSIGSAHYLRCGDEYLSVDYYPAMFLRMVYEYFKGDVYSLCEAYYDVVAQMVDRTGCDIIGHFDLITKFSERVRFFGGMDENFRLFDTSHPRYVKAWQAAADELLKTNAVFEINTGAMARGYRTEPYPSFEIIRYIADRGGRFVLSSDAHSASGIGFGFAVIEKRMKELGIELTDFTSFMVK